MLAVVREALSNVSRHAQAASAEVSLAAADSSLVLLVEDDGSGPGDGSGGRGLENIAARAGRHGGRAELRPRDPRGSQLVFDVPLRR